MADDYKTFGGGLLNLYNPRVVDFDQKDTLINFSMNNMLQKVISMFSYKNLPETIPERDFKLLIFYGGHADLVPFEGKWYAVGGRLGGRPNAYYMPTIDIVANPYLNLFKTFKIHGADPLGIVPSDVEEEAFVIPCDNLYMGVLPLVKYFAIQLTENVISKRLVTINKRATYVFVAPDNNAYEEMKDFYKDIQNGKLRSIRSKNIMQDILSLPYTDSKGATSLTDLIEDQQYIKASFFNEIGLQANYNMKRESINSNEAQLNEDMLLPYIDNLFETQHTALEEFNKCTGNNIIIEYASSWKVRKEQIENMLKQQEQAINSVVDNQVKENEQSTLVDKDEGGDEDDKDTST